MYDIYDKKRMDSMVKEKLIILAIAGESGTGKTQIEQFLLNIHFIKPLPSYTTRQAREGDVGYIYFSQKEYAHICMEDKLTDVEHGGERYFSLINDIVDPIHSRVVLDSALEYMKTNFEDRLHIISIRVKRDKELRNHADLEKRIQRDEGKFYLPDSYFDYIIQNNYSSTKSLLFDVNYIMQDIHSCYPRKQI
jgi:guanylate kinase